MHNFPLQPTTFIGRKEEIAEIGKLLADSACRLLSITGPGGIGKTRLAIESATRVSNNLFQGVYFVPLQSVRTSDSLVQAIADVFHFSLSGPDNPRKQLLNYLQEKEILLLLDNFEQILPRPTVTGVDGDANGVDLINELLQAAPDVKLLITSREVLNLQSEWVYSIEGMIVVDPKNWTDPIGVG